MGHHFYFKSLLISFSVGLMHGDFDQFERNAILKKFKQKEFEILVATDVAGIFIVFLVFNMLFSLPLYFVSIYRLVRPL